MLDTTVKKCRRNRKNYGIPVIAAIPLMESFESEKGGKNNEKRSNST